MVPTFSGDPQYDKDCNRCVQKAVKELGNGSAYRGGNWRVMEEVIWGWAGGSGVQARGCWPSMALGTCLSAFVLHVLSCQWGHRGLAFKGRHED